MSVKKNKRLSTQIRFLKVNESFFIYEEFDGKTLREICIDLGDSTVKGKSTSIQINMSSESTNKRNKIQDTTHPVKYEEYAKFFEKAIKVSDKMKFKSEIPDLSIDQLNLFDQKKLLYSIKRKRSV